MSNFEETASKKGWVPQDQWDGDPDQWVDAKEWLHRGELLNRIKDQTKQIHALRKSYDTEVRTLREKMLKMGEQWTKDRLSNINLDLNAAQKAYEDAIRNDDSDRAAALKDYMDKLGNEKKEFETTSQELEEEKNNPANNLTSFQKELQEEMASFVKENPWYGKDTVLTHMFNVLGDQEAANGDYASAQELVELTYQKLKTEFPHKFEEDEEDDYVPQKKVESRRLKQAIEPEVTPRSKAGGGSRFRALTAQEEQVARNFERSGVMSRAEYIKQLKAMEQES